jgi:hypothetical protein
MEPSTIDDVERVREERSEVIEVGKVSEETKGTLHPIGESVMFPITRD